MSGLCEIKLSQSKRRNSQLRDTILSATGVDYAVLKDTWSKFVNLQQRNCSIKSVGNESFASKQLKAAVFNAGLALEMLNLVPTLLEKVFSLYVPKFSITKNSRSK